MDVAGLLSSIELYKKQLDQVNVALESASDKNKEELQELQLNLIQVLELTLSQLDQIENNILTPKDNCVQINKLISNKCKPPNKSIDDELELFKQEIALLENSGSHSSAINDEKSSQESLSKELLELEGQEVRAPFTEKWGGHSYHNAVVLSVNTNVDGTVDLNPPKVLVLYSQPTDISMLPCRYFLEDKCTFKEDSCKFSHGKEVLVADLKEYITPNKNSIIEGSKVLALHSSDNIWHRGTVQDILPKRTAFSFDCLICKHIFEVKIEQIIPLCADELSEDEEEYSEQSSTLPIQNSLEKESPAVYNISSDSWLKNQMSCKLGEWEKHTKGIGSKLMSQMGYIVGTGLGPKGVGRVDPVPAYAYPSGVSLDHCMKLRLNSNNGEDMYSVEKRLLREQKKETEKQKKQQEFHKNTPVFDIINSKLGGNSDLSTLNGTNEAKVTVDVNQKVLKSNSTKELNRKNFQIGYRISQTQSEISRLLTAKERQIQRNDLTAIKSLDKRIDEMRKELGSLQNAERNVEMEQNKRRDVKKFVAF